MEREHSNLYYILLWEAQANAVPEAEVKNIFHFFEKFQKNIKPNQNAPPSYKYERGEPSPLEKSNNKQK